MSQLIDLCGTPIQLDKIKNFRLVKRECLFYPAYQEMENQVFSVFARLGAANKKKFKFTQMVPFGIVLSDKEKPTTGSYEFKTFGEYATSNILTDISKKIDNAASIAADMLRIDTSGNKEYRILTQGRRVTEIKLRDIPARVVHLSGKVSDVYKNDSLYEFLGEPIAPTVVAIPTLVVVVDKSSYVFFGGGIDLQDAEATYHALFEAYNQYQANAGKKRLAAGIPSFKLPKVDFSALSLQLPFGKNKSSDSRSDEPEIAALPQGLSANEELIQKLEENDHQVT